MRTYIITGATGSLGLATATFLAQEPETRVILAVRNIDRGQRAAAAIGHHTEVVELDLSSLDSIDPGLMAGTGLARTAPAPLRVVWAHLLPCAANVLPDTSTPTRSGKAAAWIMTCTTLEKPTGTIFSFDCQPSKRVWEKVFDSQIGKAVINDSLDLLQSPPSFR